jgi:hypothetical protein
MAMHVIIIPCAIMSLLVTCSINNEHNPRQRAFEMMSPEMTASFAADVKLLACAWMLDEVLQVDVDLHPHLVNAKRDGTEISNIYVKKKFQRCDSYRANTINTVRGLDSIQFSMPKHRRGA